MRVNVYIDGFNLYYGALKGTPHKWLDLDALSRRLIPNHDIHRIRYFTARIRSRPDNPRSHVRQNSYIRALAINPRISIHLGYFKEFRVRMPLANPAPGFPRTVEVVKTEEKGTDVNIATYILLDAFRRDCDLTVVISNDADLAEPMRILTTEFNQPVGLVNPFSGHPCRELGMLHSVFRRRIRNQVLRECQLPGKLRDGTGIIHRPPEW